MYILCLIALNILLITLVDSQTNPSFRPTVKPHSPIINRPQGWISLQYYSSGSCLRSSSAQGRFIAVGVCITDQKGGLLYSVTVVDSQNIQITRTKYSDPYCASGTRVGFAQQTISTQNCLASSAWSSVLPASDILGAVYGHVSLIAGPAIPDGFYSGAATR